MNLNQENARIWGEICQHTYTFDRQEKSLEILKQVTKDEFKAHAEHVFFSDQSKRLDIELNSKAHQEEQAKEFEANAEGEIFKNQLKREKFVGNYAEFKKAAKYDEDNIKANFLKFKSGN